ncbi:hypothetical protein Tco_0280867 [Tanacetum coccineum]
MEDEFYNLAVKGNDRKTYIRRFQELAVLCPNMVPNTEKLMEVFISGLPKSIEGNVTASKPQTLEEATNIAQRLMDQIIRHDSVQETNNHKRKLEDKRNINNNNYQNNYNNNNRNNDYHQQQNRRQETFKTYAATNGYTRNHLLCKSLCHCLLTLSFSSEIFKSLSFRLDRLCHLAILCLDQHAHTLHHFESLLTISLDRLDIFEGRSCISEFVRNLSMRHGGIEFDLQRKSITSPSLWFPAQSVESSNTDVLDLPCLLILITGTSQSRQHGKSESDSYYLSDYAVNSFPGTSLIHIESLPSFLSLCELIGVQQVLEVELCLNEIYLMILWL